MKNRWTPERRGAQNERLHDLIVQLRMGSIQVVKTIRAFTTAMKTANRASVGDVLQTLRQHFNRMCEARKRLAASNADCETLAVFDDCVLQEGAALDELYNVLAERAAGGAALYVASLTAPDTIFRSLRHLKALDMRRTQRNFHGAPGRD